MEHLGARLFDTPGAPESPWRIEDACGEVTGHPFDEPCALIRGGCGWLVGLWCKVVVAEVVRGRRFVKKVLLIRATEGF